MNLSNANNRQSPFKIIGNIYYVGSKFVSCHLFTSEEGHILIDAGMPGDGPIILKNIKEIGFNINDIKYLLITHSHLDHIGSAAYIKKETGAIVCVGDADIPAAEQKQIKRYDRYGNKTESVISVDELSNNERVFMNFSPIKVDQTLNDGDLLKIGTTEIQVYHMPGHTSGSCTFGFQVEYSGKKYNGLLPGGIGVNVFNENLLKNNIWGANIKDYIIGLKQMQSMDVDVWLGAHPFFNNTFEKVSQINQNKSSHPFIDADGGKEFLANWLKEAELVLSKMYE